ncbi:G patch domain-containing protein 4 [Holothuria leucospilota]|uniref:G patch domain-containing protein 4 n=1 Tax=Holothuria leucospilota TaxID=206669 RepID=A0A9Q1H8D5_HOLLE|nr:G patch domain-containing protein 4 [Holothuria leucospilota]
MRQKEDDPDLISTKRWKHKKKKKQNQGSSSGSSQLTYGIFTKTSVLTADGEKREQPEEASSSDEEDDQLLHRTEDDEALFKACEGRTAHKGARHGLTASGKLQRLEAQENGLTLTNGSFSPKPKERKRKQVGVVENDNSVVTVVDEGDEKPRKKKKKKKQSHKTQDGLIDEEDPYMLGTAVDNYGKELSNSKKKKKKKKKHRIDENIC